MTIDAIEVTPINCAADTTISAETTGKNTLSSSVSVSVLFCFFYDHEEQKVPSLPLEEFCCVTVLIAKKFFIMSNLNCL